MDNVVSIKSKSDVQLLIEGCKEDIERQDKYSLQHYHTMWLLREIMMNPNNNEEDRLAAAFIAYDNSGVRHSIKYMLDTRKANSELACKAIECQATCCTIMSELCGAAG